MQTQPLRLNKPQKRLKLWAPKSATSVWGRGTGKSWNIGDLLRYLSKTMPRAKWGIVGQTFRQILSRTLPSSIGGLQALGLNMDEDFIINRKPDPKWGWKKPFEPPVKWDHFILFPSGFGAQFISLDGGMGSARSLNLDGIITDETLLINHEKFVSEVVPANRGNLAHFGNHHMHHGYFHFTSMPYTRSGRWILDHGSYYQSNYRYDYITIRNKIIKLQIEFLDCPDKAEKLEIWKKVEYWRNQLRFFPNKQGLLYSEADAFDNIENLGLKYLEQQREILPDFIFLTEIMNKLTTYVEGGFYPGLDDRHEYDEQFDEDYKGRIPDNPSKLLKATHNTSISDYDCDKRQSLRIAVDWGSKISTLSVAQIQGDVYRFINCIFVKHPKLIDDLAHDFCEYYQWHPTKEIELIPDIAWGHKKQPDSIHTYNEKFINLLEAKGWYVYSVNMSHTADHQARYLLWHEYLSENNPELMKIRFNKIKCKYMLMSMQLAPVKEGRNGRIEKDKSSERNENIPQEEATHFSDTADNHLMSIDKTIIRKESSFVPNSYL